MTHADATGAYGGPLAAALRQLALPGLADCDLYSPEGAELYDELIGPQTNDLVDFVRAVGPASPVLDLACGSGRLTIPLAQRGRAVVGIDLSPGMLARLEAKADAQPAGVAERMRWQLGDMTALDLPERFRAAVLAATSIVLVDPERRVDFFAGVRRHLHDAGVFAFDYPVLDAVPCRPPQPTARVFPLPARDEMRRFAIVERFVEPTGRVEHVTFLVESVGADRRSDHRLVTTRKWRVSREELWGDLQAAGLEVVDTRTHRDGGETVEFAVCRPAGA